MRKRSDNGSGSAVLAQGVHINGTITCKGSCIKIDGDLDGEIISDNKVVIGKDGNITGNIASEELIVYGALKGNARVARVARIASSGFLQGNIYLKEATFAIDKGGMFVGKSLDSKNMPKKKKSGLNSVIA
jgi:cytoskeletal protein CcmA (bactofilin family)